MTDKVIDWLACEVSTKTLKALFKCNDTMVKALGMSEDKAWSLLYRATRKPVVTKKLHWTQTPEGKARLSKSMKESWKKKNS